MSQGPPFHRQWVELNAGMTPKRSGRLNLRMPVDTLARVRALAKRRRRTTSWVAVDLIEQGLAREEKKAK